MAKLPESRGRGEHALHCEFDGSCVQLRPEDITQAGVFVATAAKVALDRELELNLRSALGEIAVRCQVVQVITAARAAAERRSAGFGVLFFDLSDDQRAFIGLTLDALARAERAEKERAEALEQATARRAETLQQLTRELNALKDKPAHAVLALAADPDRAALRTAYLELSKRYHPHVYAHLDSPEISRLATELFIAHKRAYATLSAQKPAPAAAAEAPAESTASPAVATPPRLSPPPAPAPDPRARSLRPRALKEPSGVGLRNPIAPAAAAAMAAPTRVLVHSLPPRERAPRPALPPDAPPEQRRKLADAELALQSGLKHLAAARFEKADLQLDLALQLWPELREAAIGQRVCRARKCKAEGDDAAAAAEYRALLELDPEHGEALEHAGAAARNARGASAGKRGRAEGE